MLNLDLNFGVFESTKYIVSFKNGGGQSAIK